MKMFENESQQRIEFSNKLEIRSSIGFKFCPWLLESRIYYWELSKNEYYYFLIRYSFIKKLSSKISQNSLIRKA